ncbi:hypothetical protein SAMN02910292_02529 [Lachnospiraceae bacterium XBB2008]|nr:hypothetical protein SAMN02910292_02529 [Lachnospiraceae bacterium XBB2008]
MTYERFLEHIKDDDYILIKLTDTYPFFVEKVFVKDGSARTENNYHIADGMFSQYINYEMPDNGISAEISGPIKFEICGNYDCPVYVMNTSESIIEIRVSILYNFSSTCTWPIEAGEVAAIYPEHMARTSDEIYYEDMLYKKHGPIWKDKLDVNTGKWMTGIDVIDNDRALSILDEEAKREYTSLYIFDDDGCTSIVLE